MNTNTDQRDTAQYVTIISSVIISVIATLLILWLIIMYLPQGLVPQPLRSQLSVKTNDSTAASVAALAHTSGIPDVVAKATPAVVSIVISADVPVIKRYYQQYDPFNDFFGQSFNMRVPHEKQVGTQKQQVGGGSGFFVSPDGYIVTNKHVVDLDGATYTVVTNDGTSYDAKVVAKDPTMDIAILKIEGDKSFPYLQFGDDSTLRLGDSVIAIGNALAKFPNSVSVGVVSGLSRDITAGDMIGGYTESLEDVIQTDAAINKGNSGGPLLNAQGDVIGVNVAVAANSGNIGFALPIGAVKSDFESVQKNGQIVQPFAGIRYMQIDKKLAQKNSLSVDYGVLIIRGSSADQLAVIPGSAADRAGLQENDIILQVDTQKLDGTKSFANIIREHNVGDTLHLQILHKGEQKQVDLTLREAPNQQH